jgi:hypothetical protein
LSTRRLWTVLAVALPILAALAADLPSVDLAYHLRVGEGILASGSIPRADTLTFTMDGQPWLDQNWGGQVFFALVFRLGGWTGLAILRAALVGLTFACVYGACRRMGTSERSAALLTIAAFGIGSFALALRPQLVGIAIFAALLVLLAERPRRPWMLWLAVPLVVVWANVHGSFVLGLGLLGLTWLSDVLARASRPHLVLAVTAVAAVGVALNPFGFEIWRYATSILSSPTITTRISEWQRPGLDTAEGMAFYGSGMAFVAAAALAWRRGRVAWPQLLVPAAFFGLGLLAVRGLAWWPLVAATTVAGWVGKSSAIGAEPSPSPEPVLFRRLNAALVAILVIAAVVLLPGWRPIDPGLGAPTRLVGQAPSGITAALRGLVGPGARLWAPQPWSSWFEYAVPDAKLFVDSRIELYPSTVWDEYDAVIEGDEGWQSVLGRRGLTIVVTDAGGGRRPLADRLRADPAWREAYADADGAVFVPAAG